MQVEKHRLQCKQVERSDFEAILMGFAHVNGQDNTVPGMNHLLWPKQQKPPETEASCVPSWDWFHFRQLALKGIVISTRVCIVLPRGSRPGGKDGEHQLSHSQMVTCVQLFMWR